MLGAKTRKRGYNLSAVRAWIACEALTRSLLTNTVVRAVHAETSNLVAEFPSESLVARAFTLDTVAVIAAVGNFTFVKREATVSAMIAEVARAFSIFKKSVSVAHNRAWFLWAVSSTEACETLTLAVWTAVAFTVAVLWTKRAVTLVKLGLEVKAQESVVVVQNWNEPDTFV
jgi:hypothetical protein